jgi:hypothetical protein
MARRTESTADVSDRREFCRTWARRALAGILVAGGGRLFRQTATVADREDHRCDRDGICCQCRRLDACILPQAQSARRAAGGGERLSGRNTPARKS